MDVLLVDTLECIVWYWHDITTGLDSTRVTYRLTFHALITLQIDYLHILISICEFLGVQESSNPAKYLVNSN